MVVMMIIIVSLVISLFLVGDNCPFIAILGGRASICERKSILSRKVA